MRALIWLVALGMATPFAQAQSKVKKDKRNFLERLFLPAPSPSPHRKRAPTTRHRGASPSTSPAPTITPTATPAQPRDKNGFFIVDQQWYANYLELEAAWSYYMADDALIYFQDGFYYVPPVVFRHYEDIQKASLAAKK